MGTWKTMHDSGLERSLREAMSEFEIIDSHEHLGPEKWRLSMAVDVFTLFSHYTHGDLLVAGMREEDYQSLFDRTIPLDHRWELFAPYWQQIRSGTYARAALLAAQKFYDVDDINAATCGVLSERMAAANKPGLYQRVLSDACKIRTAITQCGFTDLGTPLLTPVMPLLYETESWEKLSRPDFAPDAAVHSLDDFLDEVRRYVVRVKSQGAVGLKMFSIQHGEPRRADASSTFEKLRNNPDVKLTNPNPLRDYLIDQAISIATEAGLVIAVHAGYWGDFRTLHPLHMIPILQRHTKARFDIYHLGYPWVRDTLMLAKGFPNVWLNFCWTHIISQRFAVAGLDEAMDLVPMSKILIFGGDYATPVEKVYGHLVMAREDIAEVLARRIERGTLSESRALELARQWFWDNPRQLYGLKV